MIKYKDIVLKSYWMRSIAIKDRWFIDCVAVGSEYNNVPPLILRINCEETFETRICFEI